MQFETPHQSCPLCRRPLPPHPAGVAPDTRLCDQCRGIVQGAFPALGLRSSTSVVQHSASRAADRQAVGVLDLQTTESVQREDHRSAVFSEEAESEEAEQGLPLWLEQQDEPDPSSVAADNDDLTVEIDLPDAVESESPAEEQIWATTILEPGPVNDFIEHAGDELPLFQTVVASEAEPELHNPGLPVVDESPRPEPGWVARIEAGTNQAGAIQLEPESEAARNIAEHTPEAIISERPVAVLENANSENATAQHSEEHGVKLPDVEDESVTDPWAAPLPAWDYSQNEWPVLVGPPPQKRFGLLSMAIAAAVFLLALVGAYFLFLRPAPTVRQASVPTSSPAPDSPAPIEADVPPAKASEPQQVAASLSPAAQITSTPEDENGHGKYSLQAASFPNLAAANEFAQKLKGARVPSYVISTDLKRRGTWFRVRVGRFNTPEDAQRFAVEAQLRAKAVGMSLQLITCQFDQP